MSLFEQALPDNEDFLNINIRLWTDTAMVVTLPGSLLKKVIKYFTKEVDVTIEEVGSKLQLRTMWCTSVDDGHTQVTIVKIIWMCNRWKEFK